MRAGSEGRAGQGLSTYRDIVRYLRGSSILVLELLALLVRDLINEGVVGVVGLWVRVRWRG